VGGPLGLRLDHVLVRDIAVCDVETPRISDQRGVMIVVSLHESHRE